MLVLVLLPSALLAKDKDLLKKTLDAYSAQELFPGPDRIGTP